MYILICLGLLIGIAVILGISIKLEKCPHCGSKNFRAKKTDCDDLDYFCDNCGCVW